MEINLHWNNIEDVKIHSPFHLEPEQLEVIKRWKNRFNIPIGLTKKEYTALLKTTQDKINDCLKRMRELGPGDNIMADIDREQWVEKKVKINRILKIHHGFGENVNMDKAKAFPIEELLEFNSGGFTKCPFHDEKSGSAKLYKTKNKIHCFGACAGDFDSIDIAQKLFNLSFNDAIKKLS